MYIVLDLETTWLLPKSDKIIECAFVKYDRKNWKEVDRFHTFVNPNCPVPELISSITHIYDSDVSQAPHIDDIRDSIEDFIEGFPLIGHNISFDISFLEAAWIDISKNPYIDTFHLANFLCFEQKSLNLWHLCDTFSIPLHAAHRAIDDTIATWKLFYALTQKLQSLPEDRKQFVYSLLSHSHDPGLKIFFYDFCVISEKLYSKDDIFSEYIKLFQESRWTTFDKIYYKDGVNLDSIWSDLWVLDQRESQKIMVDNIDTTFSKWKKMLIEAPTGTGKTFGYLIPAIKYSLNTWDQVHVSTSTKVLQDQIFYKDLELLSENISTPFSYTKLKGRSNYLSILSLSDLYFKADMSQPQVLSFFLKIFIWSVESEFWELDELDFYGKEYEFLWEVHAWNIWVQSDKNIYREYEFLDIARNRAKKSNIVVTNNHILFRDILWEWSILGEVKNLVIDEAHTLEDVATSSLQESLSYKKFSSLTEKFKEKSKKYTNIDEQIIEKFMHMLFDAEHIFGILEWLLFSKVSRDMKYKNYLLRENDFSQIQEGEVLIGNIITSLKNIRESLDIDEKNEYIVSELQELDFIEWFLMKFTQNRDINSYIYYLSHSDQKGLEIHMTVLQVWDFLSRQLWSRLESCILTSATLQMNNNFSFIQSSLWWNDFETLILPTDFNYEKQALVFIPNNLWSIKYNLPQVTEFLRELYLHTKGKTLSLFTSYAVIKEIYIGIQKILHENNIELLAQSISWGKHKLSEYFKKNSDRAVLLGTNTFWEWLDIPWDNLQYLVIHKIPFPVPNDPIFSARSKLYKNSFEEYAIPKAMIKIQQWFGRLIRSKNDTWVCIFLDDRVYSSSWWESFLKAFPENIKIRYGSSEKLFSILEASK